MRRIEWWLLLPLAVLTACIALNSTWLVEDIRHTMPGYLDGLLRRASAAPGRRIDLGTPSGSIAADALNQLLGLASVLLFAISLLATGTGRPGTARRWWHIVSLTCAVTSGLLYLIAPMVDASLPPSGFEDSRRRYEGYLLLELVALALAWTAYGLRRSQQSRTPPRGS